MSIYLSVVNPLPSCVRPDFSIQHVTKAAFKQAARFWSFVFTNWSFEQSNLWKIYFVKISDVIGQTIRGLKIIIV